MKKRFPQKIILLEMPLIQVEGFMNLKKYKVDFYSNNYGKWFNLKIFLPNHDYSFIFSLGNTHFAGCPRSNAQLLGTKSGRGPRGEE